MGVIVTFDYATWISEFPEMAGIDAVQAQWYFDMATVVCMRNDGGGPVNKARTQSILLDLATAHLTYLFALRDSAGNPATGGTVGTGGIVGRISNATQGSVSVGTDAGQPQAASEAWWQQSKYGSTWWMATSIYRSFRYLTRGPRVFDPWLTSLLPRTAPSLIGYVPYPYV